MQKANQLWAFSLCLPKKGVAYLAFTCCAFSTSFIIIATIMKGTSSVMKHESKLSSYGLSTRLSLNLITVLAIMLLFSHPVVNAQQTANQPASGSNADSVSGIESIDAQEAQDEANGTIDSRTEPYVMMKYIALNHQVFLPVVAGGTQ